MQTDPLSPFGVRQRQLLTLLLENREGMSVEELARELAISRSAVHQHLNALERDDYVEKSAREPRGGRPGYAFRLTDRGVHLFPKHYALFSDLLIRSLKEKFGSEGLSEILRDLGQKLAREHAPRLEGLSTDEQIRAVASIMQELGYQARAVGDGSRALPLIDARNCVYHHLAREHHEVCDFDLALLSSLLNSEIEHVECMLRGGVACRFRVLKAARRRK
jgi:predicted ArsR family transcriptional regulator